MYHPVMQHILRLATMEVTTEFIHKIIWFWELFNEILSDIKGRDYKFNPKAIMVNENSANYCTIQQIFEFISFHHIKGGRLSDVLQE